MEIDLSLKIESDDEQNEEEEKVGELVKEDDMEEMVHEVPTAGEVEEDDASVVEISLQDNTKTREVIFPMILLVFFFMKLLFSFFLFSGFCVCLLIYACVITLINSHVFTKKSDCCLCLICIYMLQLIDLKMEMESMKEENKVLRKVVEQTMKDYYDLQMKFSIIQENNKRKVNHIVWKSF